MAPGKKNQWADGKWGKWAKENWNGWAGEQKKGGKVLVDWACCICDVNAEPNYQGNYAIQSFCPDCKTEKRLACHMTMETRRARIKAGTLKPKAQARAEREARAKGNTGQSAAGNGQAVVFDAKAADDAYAAKLLHDFMTDKINKDELKELKAKGRPPENNSNPNAMDQKSGQGVVGAEGVTSASTQPQDFDNKNSNWNKVGPTPAELKKNLEIR